MKRQLHSGTRRPTISTARVVLALSLISAAPLLWSCGENTETIIYETDTVAVHDTTVRYDTIVDWDTVTTYEDTLYDTMFLPAGKDPYLLFGLVCDVSSTWGSATAPFDSVYAGVTCFANPARHDLRVRANGDSVPLEFEQREYVLSVTVPDLAQGYLFPAANMVALLKSTLYEGFVSKDSLCSLAIVVPVYPADTTDSLTFDTLQEAIALPPLTRPYAIATSAGPVPYITGDTALDVSYFRVPGDSALTITWPDNADFYMVSLQRIAMGSTGFVGVGAGLDTITEQASWTIPKRYLSYSSTMPDSLKYDFAELSIVALNGTPPSSWDTLPTFDNQGVLLAVNDTTEFEFLIPENGELLMGKRRESTIPRSVVKRGSSVELVLDALKRRW